MRKPFKAFCLGVLAALSSVQAAEKPRHQQINYGPFVSATVESAWPRGNISYKGLAIRLTKDGKDIGGILYDTDLVRMASAWTGGFLNMTKDVMRARNHRSILPYAEPIAATGQTPTWSQPGTVEYSDPRERPFGPMPRDWVKYLGLYTFEDKSIVSYTNGQARILELPQAEVIDGQTIITRTLNISNMNQALSSVLTERSGTTSELVSGTNIAILKATPESSDNTDINVTTDRTPSNGNWLKMGFAIGGDYGNKKKGVTVSFDPKNSKVRKPITKENSTIPLLQDGNGAQHDKDRQRAFFFESDGGTLYFDLETQKELRSIQTYSWHRDVHAAQDYEVFGTTSEKRPEATDSSWQKIAKVNTTNLDAGGIHAASINRGNGVLGTYRYLMFKVKNVNGQPTWFTEIDVQATSDRPKFKRMNPDTVIAMALVKPDQQVKLANGGSKIELKVNKSKATQKLKVAMWSGPQAELAKFIKAVDKLNAAEDLTKYTKGGPANWPKTITTQGSVSKSKKAYVVDTITLPEKNPYGSWFRLGGFDFFKDPTKAAISNWNGDVWTVSGVDADLDELRWKRVATGLFHPLGLVVSDESIYVLGRDQITKLVDLNGDGETDFYESFNNDVEVTWNFHEFTFDLQQDDAGNFYFSKGAPVRNGGRGFDYIAKHHGTVVKVSPDGKTSKVIATGLRAPNGISVRGDGQVTTGDNEGSWMPRCRLNLVKENGFYGVMNTSHRKTLPKTYDAPICWLPKSVDNSGGGQAWVNSNKWGPFKDELLHLSYGTCSLYKAMYEHVDGTPQGGVVRMPVNFASGIMRARFNKGDGQLYTCGLRGWQTSAAVDSTFARVRYTGAPLTIPTKLNVLKDGIEITFTEALDKEEAEDTEAYSISQWNYKYSEAYGSSEYSVKNPSSQGKDAVKITSAKLSEDGKKVKLTIPGIKPVMQMRIKVDLLDADDEEVIYEIFNTINKVPTK